MCVPSFILKIIDYAEEHGIDYRNSSIKKVVCIGENLREQDFSLNLLGHRIKEKWDIELYSTYASTEMATTFAECQYGCGGHHHPELIICEVVDDEGNVVDDGQVGELVVTTLGVEGMPLLRFKTGDLVCFHTEGCRCGRNSMRVSPVVGRANHLLKYKGTTLYPPAIYDVLDNSPYVENYLIEISTNEIGNNYGIETQQEISNLSATVSTGSQTTASSSSTAKPQTQKRSMKSQKGYVSYKVRSGDSLMKIARKYPGVTVTQIQSANRLKNSTIHAGQILKIPVG